MMVHSYTTTVFDSVLALSLTVCYFTATAKHEGRLQQIICAADSVIGYDLSHLSRTSRTLWYEAVVHRDQKFTPQKWFLAVCRWQITLTVIPVTQCITHILM